jgi:hypothetical protein
MQIVLWEKAMAKKRQMADETILRFHGVSMMDFPSGSIDRAQEAEIIINKSGTVIKDRPGHTGRRASNKEMQEAVWVEEEDNDGRGSE